MRGPTRPQRCSAVATDAFSFPGDCRAAGIAPSKLFCFCPARAFVPRQLGHWPMTEYRFNKSNGPSKTPQVRRHGSVALASVCNPDASASRSFPPQPTFRAAHSRQKNKRTRRKATRKGARGERSRSTPTFTETTDGTRRKILRLRAWVLLLPDRQSLSALSRVRGFK